MDVLDLLREEVPREIESRVPTEHARATQRGRCVQSTHVGIAALEYFGIKSKPLVTLIMAGNAAWSEWMIAGQEQPMPDEAWSVGTNPVHNPEDKGYPAHLVIEIDGQLLDLDAGFYARPHKGIHVPPTILTPIRPKVPNGPIAGTDLEDGGAVIYYDRSAHKTAPPNFRGSGAWKHTATWAGPVIRRMRERLP